MSSSFFRLKGRNRKTKWSVGTTPEEHTSSFFERFCNTVGLVYEEQASEPMISLKKENPSTLCHILKEHFAVDNRSVNVVQTSYETSVLKSLRRGILSEDYGEM